MYPILQIKTQEGWINSPLYFEHLKDELKLDDWPFVNVRGEVIVSMSHEAINDFRVQISTRSWWKDPQKYPDDPDAEGQEFSATIELNRNQVVFLKKYLDAFLENTKDSGPE